MVIPNSFKVGKLTYTVLHPFVLDYGRVGDVLYKHALIRIAWSNGQKTRTPRQRAETFWHETTHAILHDMGNPLWKDEKFVTEFSRRLNQVVHTARLS